MNPLDPLSTPVDRIPTPVVVDLNSGHEPELFFDGVRFLEYLDGTFKSFDVLTYSLSKSSEAPLGRIRRLITNHPLAADSSIRPKETRVVINNHAKLFFCYDHQEALKCVYLGSQNLTHGTQINIMYRAQTVHNQCLIRFFDNLWNKANENRNRKYPTRKPSLPHLR